MTLSRLVAAAQRVRPIDQIGQLGAVTQHRSNVLLELTAKPVHSAKIKRIGHSDRDQIAEHKERERSVLLGRRARQQGRVGIAHIELVEIDEGNFADRRTDDRHFAGWHMAILDQRIEHRNLSLDRYLQGSVDRSVVDTSVFAKLPDNEVVIPQHCRSPRPRASIHPATAC